jgi:DNA-binding XRE family transcriptional regulator
MKMTSKSVDYHERDLELVGKNLRRLRVRHGLTQEMLSRSVGLNIRTLQRIEAGKTNILITTAMRLITSLSCTPDELLIIDRDAPTED